MTRSSPYSSFEERIERRINQLKEQIKHLEKIQDMLIANPDMVDTLEFFKKENLPQ